MRLFMWQTDSVAVAKFQYFPSLHVQPAHACGSLYMYTVPQMRYLCTIYKEIQELINRQPPLRITDSGFKLLSKRSRQTRECSLEALPMYSSTHTQLLLQKLAQPLRNYYVLVTELLSPAAHTA